MSLLSTPAVHYGGTYRAVCLEVLPDRVRAQVPQVFADTVVTIFEFSGRRPAEGDEGWVVFESGLAERPIWIGTESLLPELPPGGALGQVLTKKSVADRDVDWEEIFPPGGITGDVLTKQVVGEAWLTPTPASYWFSNFATPASMTGGAGKVQMQPNTPTIASGFHRHANTTVVVCDVAGLYRVGVHLTFTSASPASNYSDTYIEVHDPINFSTILASSNPVGVGGGFVSSSFYFASDGELLCYLRVGDYVSIYVASDATHSFQASRSYLSIVPVGAQAGPVGPTGPMGPDVTLVQSNYWFGSIASPLTALGNDVQTNIGWTMTRSNGFTLASSNQRITPALPGRYKVTAAPSYSNGANASAYCRAAILHYDSAGVLKSSVSAVGSGSPASSYSQAVAIGEFETVAGDYFVIQGAIANTTGVLISNSYCTVVPVGGTKGDKGDKGDRGLAGGTSTPWTLMVGNAGWNNYTPTSGAGYAQAAYRLHDDVVELRGLVYSTGTPSVAISNLPVGFRPPSGNQIFACYSAAGAVRVDVTTAGDILYSTTPVAYLDLSTIRFSITP